MSPPMSTMERISAVLTGPLRVDGSRVTPGATMHDLGFDSLDLIDFVVELETEFEFSFMEDDPAFAKVITLADLAATIDVKKARAA